MANYEVNDDKVNAMYIDMLINKKEFLKKMHAEFKSLVKDEQAVGSHMTGILNKVMNEVAFWKPDQATNNVEVMENIVEELNMILEDSAITIKDTNYLLKKLNNTGNILIGNVQKKVYVSTEKIEALRENLNTVDEMIEARKAILQINDAKIDYLQTKIYNDLVAGAASFKDTDNVRKKFRENFVPNSIFGTLKSNVKIIRNKLDAAFGVSKYYEEKNIVREVDDMASKIEACSNCVESSGTMSSKFPTEGELLLLTEINDEEKRLENWEKKFLSSVMIRNKQMSQEEKRLAVQSEEAGLADAIQLENQQADATQSENKQAGAIQQAGLELGAVQFQPQQAETLVEFARGAMKGNMNTQATRLTTLKQIISRRIEGRASSVTTGNAWKTLTSFGGEEGGGSSGNRESKFISTPDNLPERPEDVPEVLKEGMLGFYALDGKLKSRLSNFFREGGYFNFLGLEDYVGLKEFPEFMAVYNKWLDKIGQKENEGLLPKINAEALRKNLTFMGYDKDIKQQLEAIPLTRNILRLVYTRTDQKKNIIREIIDKRDKPNAADPGFLWSISEERAPPHVLDPNDPFKGVQSRLLERLNDLLRDPNGKYITMEKTIAYNIETLKGVVDQAIKSDFDQAVKKQHKMILGLYNYEQHHEKEVLWINEPPESRMSTFTDVITGVISTITGEQSHANYNEISTELGNIGDMLGISEARKLQIPIVCGPAFIGKKAWNSPEVHRGCQIIANQQQELLELKSRMVEREVKEPLNVLTGGLSFAAYMVNKLPDYNPDTDNRYMPKPEWVILDNLQFDKDNLLENFDKNFETTDDFNILYLNKVLSDTSRLV